MKKIFFLLFILPFILSSCSSTKVFSDYDPTVDFKQFKTFSLLPWNKQSDEILSDFDKRRFQAAVTYELENLGYQKVEANADLSVNIFIIIDEKPEHLPIPTIIPVVLEWDIIMVLGVIIIQEAYQHIQLFIAMIIKKAP